MHPSIWSGDNNHIPTKLRKDLFFSRIEYMIMRAHTQQYVCTVGDWLVAAHYSSSSSKSRKKKFGGAAAVV